VAWCNILYLKKFKEKFSQVSRLRTATVARYEPIRKPFYHEVRLRVKNTVPKQQNKIPYFSIDNARVIYTKKV